MKTELFSVWSAEREKDIYIQYHSHDYYEVVFYKAGNGTTNIGDKQYFFHENEFVLIPPYVKHDEIHHECGQVICICFYFDEELSTEFYSCEKNGYKTIIEEMLSEATNQSYGYEDVLESLLTTLIIKMMRKNMSVRVTGKSDFTFIMKYIADNYHEKMSLKQLAKQLNISYDYFRHRFKEQTGYSPQQFLVMKRLEAAKRMLRDNQLSCTEIAYRCGFSNSAQFSMLFKKECDMTPLEFRKNQGVLKTSEMLCKDNWHN